MARVFVVGGVISYRALFNWVRPLSYATSMLGIPVTQLLFFAYLGRFTGLRDDEFYVVGNAVQATAMGGVFAMTMTVGNERQFRDARAAARVAGEPRRVVPRALAPGRAQRAVRVGRGLHGRPVAGVGRTEPAAHARPRGGTPRRRRGVAYRRGRAPLDRSGDRRGLRRSGVRPLSPARARGPPPRGPRHVLGAIGVSIGETWYGRWRWPGTPRPRYLPRN